MRIIIDEGIRFDGDLEMFERKFFSLPPEYTLQACGDMIRDWCHQLGYTCRIEWPVR